MSIKDPKETIEFYNNKYSEEQIREFIKKYPEKIDGDFWYSISTYQDLSEDFIRSFKDKFSWWSISQYQDLSEEFLIDNIKGIKIGNDFFRGLLYNKNIPKDVKNRIITLKRLLDSD